MVGFPRKAGENIVGKKKLGGYISLRAVQCHQTEGTREIFCTRQSRTCFCDCQVAASIPKDALSGSAKADFKTEYAVCSGKPDSGGQTWSGGLIQCCLNEQFMGHPQLFYQLRMSYF